MKPTPDDYAEARRLLAPDWLTAGRLTAGGYQHDHDEELGTWDNRPSPSPSPNTRTVADVIKALRDRRRLPRAYWVETGSLVREYLVLQAGATYTDALRRGFIAWVRRSPGERRRFEEGDDMARAALVDWYLRVVR